MTDLMWSLQLRVSDVRRAAQYFVGPVFFMVGISCTGSENVFREE
jgi:hypothetical protein